MKINADVYDHLEQAFKNVRSSVSGSVVTTLLLDWLWGEIHAHLQRDDGGAKPDPLGDKPTTIDNNA